MTGGTITKEYQALLETEGDRWKAAARLCVNHGRYRLDARQRRFMATDAHKRAERLGVAGVWPFTLPMSELRSLEYDLIKAGEAGLKQELHEGRQMARELRRTCSARGYRRMMHGYARLLRRIENLLRKVRAFARRYDLPVAEAA